MIIRKGIQACQFRCLLASIICIAITAASIPRDLTSESSAAAITNIPYNLRASTNIKIKNKCPNINYILGPIHNADVDGNGVLNKEEYVNFADAVSGGFLTENDRADNFLDMPLSLQETYVVLSCLCELYQSEPWGGKGCCTAGSDVFIGIQTNGTAPDDELTNGQLDYYTYVCGTMTDALDSLGLELVSPPTMKPSNRPTTRPTKEPTSEPTVMATPIPTLRPVTIFPTSKPTENSTTEKIETLSPMTLSPEGASSFAPSIVAPPTTGGTTAPSLDVSDPPESNAPSAPTSSPPPTALTLAPSKAPSFLLIPEVPVESNKLDTGAIIGICVAGTLVLYVLIAFVRFTNKAGKKDDEEFDLERQPVSDVAAKDMTGPSSPDSKEVGDSWSIGDVSEAQTNTSQDHLLPQSQIRSTAEPALGKFDEGDDWSESESTASSGAVLNLTAGSSLAAVGMASTFVAANAGLNESSASAGAECAPDTLESRGVLGAESLDNAVGGNEIALRAVGAVTAGALAAGAYAVTKDKISSSEEAEPQSPIGDTSSSNLDHLGNAIEAGNWGAVGAIAAILASSGHPAKIDQQPITSEDFSAKSDSRGSSTGPTLDRARANEIDKLVEAGDWQGVVLAAARFEADQTMDGESYSASASKSSYRSGSAQSSATPRSIATSAQSSTNIDSGRSQAEVKAEIEALVKRVVPEEADNVDEMLTQFKGREEELVETLRRMQERAIASRARLAVQKSAKLEARARAIVPTPNPSSSSVNSWASSKSELEAAIEAGNWEAVGQAAQKISDSSEAFLSMEDRSRLREKVSASPALTRIAGSSSEDYDLDALIERGDWPGVIAAAKKVSEETQASSSNMTQEEQEALAQANMWQEIANQSKQEGRQGPAGADDAAAWAISRSLNALYAPQDEEGAVRTIEDMADDESSEASQYESSSYSASKSQSQSADYYRHGI